MRKILKILFFLFILINIMSLENCKKNTQFFRTRIVGKITNKITGEPMSNVEIKLLRYWKTSYYGNSDDEYVTSFYTDANGKFDYSFHAKRKNEQAKDEDYVYKIKPNIPFNECVESFGDIYFNNSESSYVTGLRTYELKEKHKNEVDIKFDPAPAYLELHIKNQAPFDNNDKICVKLSRWSGTCDFLINIGGDCYTGMAVDTTITIKLDKYGWDIFYSYTKNSITYNSSGDTFAIPENSTLQYNINY